jgi:hypothetical protein
MITLKRHEGIEVFQVELSMKLKTKQSPFIAVLILAQELGKVSGESLQESLLSSLPLRACENLLKRLEAQGYLQIGDGDIFGDWYSNSEYCVYYSLTDLGEQCAMDRSFWIGEKGVYNVHLVHSSLLEQRIVSMDRVERAEDDRNANMMTTPWEISRYENHAISVNGLDIRIEDIERRCFRMPPVQGILEIQADGDGSLLSISMANRNLLQADMNVSEYSLREELLISCDDVDYHQGSMAVLSEFNRDNLSFSRKVRIGSPIFKGVSFDPVDLDNVLHIPSDKRNANLWYLELLYRNIYTYFYDDSSFENFASETAKPIQQYYNVKIPNREQLIEIFSKRKDSFYQIAKLEAIDYLTYGQ